MMRALLVLSLVAGLSGCSTIKSAKLLVPTWFGFTEIREGVYVDDKMSQTEREKFLKTLDAAKDRVAVFFGGLEASPKVFACSTEECFVSRGGVTAKGKAYGSSMILLSPRGLNEVIVSHELAHNELHGRIGAFRSWRSVPSWFDEGLAVLVSDDPRYTEDAWLRATDHGRTAPNLDEIGKLLGNGPWLISYGTARRAVGAWYSCAGAEGLMLLIAEVKSGTDFDSAFKPVTRFESPLR